MHARSVPLADYRKLVGTEIGVSDWLLIDQARIDAFADATLDRQFIHVDPVAAAATPFGGTVAHGFLTLSVVPGMCYDSVPAIQEMKFSVNYGLQSLRFVTAVASGKRVRARFTLTDVTERKPDQWQSTFGVTVEIEGKVRPALVAEWLVVSIL